MTAMLSPPCSHELKTSDVCGAENDGLRRHALGIEIERTNNEFAEERCREILSYYEEESHRPEHEDARWLVGQLGREEQEIAAQCSYAYWYLSRRSLEEPSAQAVKDPARFASAMQEARRHLDCADHRSEVLKVFRETLDFHRSHKTALYRTCMVDAPGADKGLSDSEKELSKGRRERIGGEMNDLQTNVVRGHDREDRAIFFAFPRRTAGTSEDAFVDSLVYTVERAAASSEFQSIGRQDQIVVVLETKGSSCPPFKTLQAAVGILQNFYPGRLKTCVILNPHYVVTGIFRMIKPFMHPLTFSKFVLVKAKRQSGIAEEDSVLSRLIDESQAMPEMMPGRGKLASKVDVDRFLYKVPFYRLYDCTDPEHDPKLLDRETHSTTSTTLSLSSSSSSSSLSLSSDAADEDELECDETTEPLANLERGTAKAKPTRVALRSLAVGQLSVRASPGSPMVVDLRIVG